MSGLPEGRLEGGCLCGKVRYVLAPGFRIGPYACHCVDCQTRTGSAFSEHLMILLTDLEASGAEEVGRSRNPGGAEVTLFGCATCGTRLWVENEQRPGMASLRCGTLDRSGEVQPRAHLWTRSKQTWISIPDAVPQLETQPRTNEEWLTLLGPGT